MPRDLVTVDHRSPSGQLDWPLGAHLVTPRLGYTHHGIYVGAGRVVHYAGWSRALVCAPVQEVSVAQFAGGRAISVRAHPDARYGAAAIVARARSRVGEDRYQLTRNNCEHFASWCVLGEARSTQVDAWTRPLHALARSVRRAAAALRERASYSPSTLRTNRALA